MDREPLDVDVLAAAQVEGQLRGAWLPRQSGLVARWRDEIERVLLPMPLARLVEGMDVADDHAPSFLGLVAARISSAEPPGVGEVADAGSRPAASFR